MVLGEDPGWDKRISGKEMFPGWCPHCQGSSHSFQPDVLGQGAGHSLSCAEDVSPKGLCTGACWQGWHGADGPRQPR